MNKLGKVGRSLNPRIDYLEVHANLSETEKKQIQTRTNDVKIIFMTSSGSRGLSFPKVNSILVDIPRFQVEKNLMEIIQVIYRGRGNKQLDQLEKQLIFYLGENAFYNQDDPQISLQESSLNIINLLLILKAAILTRIVGNGTIGRQDCLIIPIGGKSVSAAGESFSLQLANLLRELKQESHRKPSDIRLKRVYEQFRQLLNNTDFKLYPSDDNQGKTATILFSLTKAFK